MPSQLKDDVRPTTETALMLASRSNGLTLLVLTACAISHLSQPTPPAHHVDTVLEARGKYESDLAAAVEPIQKRYKDRLESLQRELTKKGDLDGALAAKSALEQLAGEAAVSEWQRFAGKWTVQNDNGATHTYEISKDGAVHYIEEGTKLRLEARSGDVVLDFGGGKIERLTTALTTEMFRDGAYPAGKPQNRGSGGHQGR